MTSIPSITSLTLELPPSCISFCPDQPDLFVVGTYVLHPKEDESKEDAVQKRSGSLILYQLRGTDIVHLQTIPLGSAVLDIEWLSFDGCRTIILAVATSTGLIILFDLDSKKILLDTWQLAWRSTRRIADPSVLVLYLQWKHCNWAPQGLMGVTLSDGRVCICVGDVLSDWGEKHGFLIVDVSKHELEPWTLAFTADTNGVLSGGDDALLQRADMTNEPLIFSATTVWQDRKTHQAGVTAILPLADDLIVTGSYDDHIRLSFAPTSGRRKTLTELHLGGGVWRLKLLDSEPTKLSSEVHGAPMNRYDPPRAFLPSAYNILASCMHAGSRILRLLRDENGSWSFHVLARFEEHKSMNYGTDVRPSKDSLKTFVSTSFYDKLMCLWQYDLSNVDTG